MPTRSIIIVLAALAGLALPGPIYAEDAPAKTIKYRDITMDALGKHMGSTSMVLKGHVDRPQDLAHHARAIHDISKTVPDLFPKGSLGDSGSKKEIWEDWEDFVALSKKFEEASAALVAATAKHDLAAVKDAFGAVGKTCGDCHDKYRVEEEE